MKHLLLLFTLSALTLFGATPEHKNVLVILVDDLGYHDLGFMGSDYYESPNVDKLAQEGVVFTDGYAACNVCSPSRVSIMTGQSTARHGVTDWLEARSGEDWRLNNRYSKLLPPSYVNTLPVAATTLPEAMQSLGYTTFFTGKWHMGYQSGPAEHGFDYATCRGGGTPRGGYYAPFDNANIDENYPGESLTMRLAEETVNFMTEHKDEKFFAYLSFHAVHGPIQTTKEKWQKFRDKADSMGIADKGFKMGKYLPTRIVQDNPIYAGLIETMDDAVGLVLDAMQELGLEENTAIIFTSDNGGVSAGDNYSTSNLPLQMGKGNPYEGGFRVPFLIKVPWLNVGHKESKTPISGVDIYPTVLDLVDADMRPQDHVDGVSLLPIVKGDTIGGRSIVWHYPHYANQGGEPVTILRKGKWKLMHRYEGDVDQLYDLSSDVAEANDLAAVHSTLVDSLRAEMDAYLTSVNALYPVPDPLYNAVSEQQRITNIEQNTLPNVENQRKAMLAKTYSPGNDWWGSDVTLLPLKEKQIATFETTFTPDASSVKQAKMSSYFASSGTLVAEHIIDNPKKDDINSTHKCFAVEIENFKWDNNIVWMPIDTTPGLNWIVEKGVKIDQLNQVKPSAGITITDDTRYLHVMHYRSSVNNGGASVAINTKHIWNNGQGVARFDFSNLPADEWVDLVCDLDYFKKNNLQVGHISLLNSTQWGAVASTHPDFLAGSDGKFKRTTFAWDELVLSSQPIKRVADGSVAALRQEQAQTSAFFPVPFNGQRISLSNYVPGVELSVYDLSGNLKWSKKLNNKEIIFNTELSESLYVFQLKDKGQVQSFLVPVSK